jgi:hypothetical protein
LLSENIDRHIYKKHSGDDQVDWQSGSEFMDNLEGFLIMMAYMAIASIIFFIAGLIYHLFHPQTRYSLPANTNFTSAFNPTTTFSQIQPSVVYHGTSYHNAFEIFRTGLWLVGAPHSEVWMTADFSIACTYAGNNGAIVECSIASNVFLNNIAGNIYTYDIRNARPGQEYYKISGITPTAVYDPNGKRLA